MFYVHSMVQTVKQFSLLNIECIKYVYFDDHMYIYVLRVWFLCQKTSVEEHLAR